MSFNVTGGCGRGGCVVSSADTTGPLVYAIQANSTVYDRCTTNANPSGPWMFITSFSGTLFNTSHVSGSSGAGAASDCPPIDDGRHEFFQTGSHWIQSDFGAAWEGGAHNTGGHNGQ